MVELFPGEEFHFFLYCRPVVGSECFFHHAGSASHVTVAGGFLVYGIAQFQPFLDGFWTEVEDFVDFPGDGGVIHGHFGRAVGVHENSDGTGDADGVGYLDEHLVGNSRGDHVLGDVAGGIGRGAVHFGGVFAGECTTTVGSLAAVSVHDDFTAGETGVPVRSADYEFPGRVHVQDEAFVKKGLYPGGKFRFYPREEDILDVLVDLLNHPGIGLQLCFGAVVGWANEFVMLRGDHDGVHAEGTIVVVVFDGDL